ncbi:hypothetical protein ASD21_14155 [Caulobacter sp. Root1455]|jgi:hypothetical protein|uniref:hypothetical protein n=1 Tax=unclassified Caulobacter TaxID=2648921 RepID=UPI0006F2FFF1|nr:MULTISPECIES: hypothetical protein [unclassified Caulobacter]KQY30236.1 hypothetical protein ASD38_13220 [Caulobacter sp. Root487D2Y]KQY92535.1 hypothetical protein ASD21_14155 [Caulobacter sp. Root1455]
MSPKGRAVASALISLTLASTVPFAAKAEAGKVAPATKVFSFLEAFLKVPPAERSRIKLSYALLREGKRATGVKATLIEANGVRTPLPIDGEGRFERTPTLAQLQAKAQVSFDVSADTKLGSTMLLDPVLKPAVEYDARELVVTVDDSNRAIRKAAGPMAMMAPQMDGLKFLTVDSGVAIFPNGSSKPLPAGAEGVVFEPGQFKGASRVRLAKAPSAVDYYVKKK